MQLCKQRLPADLGDAKAAPQRVVVHEDAVDLGAERVQVFQILHADGAPADLVLVGGADAAPRGADLLNPRARFPELVELAVQGQDQRRILGDAQVLARDRHALRLQLVDLGDERPGIDDDAIADDAELAGAHDARREQRKLVGLIADDERVAGVVAALEAHHHIGALRQPVDDLALALIAPLGADDDDVGHDCSPCRCGRRGRASHDGLSLERPRGKAEPRSLRR